MGFVSARGGEEAIQRAEQLYRALLGPLRPELVQSIQEQLPQLVDRVMGESSLYAPQLAALALAQTGGDLYESVLLLRAYRSTQPRLAYALPVSADTMTTVRRISAAFKDIPGGQVLGPTLDYSHRLLRLDLLDHPNPSQDEVPVCAEEPAPEHYQAVADWHRAQGLLSDPPEKPSATEKIPDVTREPILFPPPRAQRLQSLARADTGGLLALGYARMRGYGVSHPTVNELRVGWVDVQLRHPVTGATFVAGKVRASFAEVVKPFAAQDEDEGSTFSQNSETPPQLDLGFTATLGWNEVKVIAGAMLDQAMNEPSKHPAHEEEFILYHTEPVEASGFCIHYKLPHYVTFASILDALRGARGNEDPASVPTAQTEANP